MRSHTSQVISVSSRRVMHLLFAMAYCALFAALTQAQSSTHELVVDGRSGIIWMDTGLDIEPNTLLQFSARGTVDVGSRWGAHGPLGTPTGLAHMGTNYPWSDAATRYGLLARLIRTHPPFPRDEEETWVYNNTGGFFPAVHGGHLWLTVNDDYSADNSGAFKVRLETTTFPDEKRCLPCPFDKITVETVLNQPLPDPKALQSLLVLGGEIIAINRSAGLTLVTVSQGSVLGKYGDLPNLKVVFAKGAAGSGPSLSKQGVVQGLVFQNQKMSLIIGASQLKLDSKQIMPD